jgi:2-oxoglutarate ferredoxin oxidoreductase subunit alpha
MASVESVVVRFAGDSGDGIQVTGSQFAESTGFVGNDLATFPEYPSEIRAPAGTLAGVSGFQIHFSSAAVWTHGDQVDVLVALNPAALKVNLATLKKGGLLLVNTDAFEPKNLEKAGYAKNPLEDGSLRDYRLVAVPMTTQAIAAVEHLKLPHKDSERTRNFYALGLVFWLFNRDLDYTIGWIEEKFAKKPAIAQAKWGPPRSPSRSTSPCAAPRPRPRRCAGVFTTPSPVPKRPRWASSPPRSCPG